MTRKNTSIGGLKTEPRLTNIVNCEEKSVDVSASTPRSFRPNRMRRHTPHRKRDFGSTGRNTEPHGYCAIRGAVA